MAVDLSNPAVLTIGGWLVGGIVIALGWARTWGKVSQIISSQEARLIATELLAKHNETCVHRIELDTATHRATVLERMRSLDDSLGGINLNMRSLSDGIRGPALTPRWSGVERRKGA